MGAGELCFSRGGRRHSQAQIDSGADGTGTPLPRVAKFAAVSIAEAAPRVCFPSRLQTGKLEAAPWWRLEGKPCLDEQCRPLEELRRELALRLVVPDRRHVRSRLDSNPRSSTEVAARYTWTRYRSTGPPFPSTRRPPLWDRGRRRGPRRSMRRALTLISSSGRQSGINFRCASAGPGPNNGENSRGPRRARSSLANIPFRWKALHVEGRLPLPGSARRTLQPTGRLGYSGRALVQPSVDQ